MIFVRTGPRFLFLSTPDTERLKDVLVTQMAGRLIDFTEAIELSEEGDTIALIIPAEVTQARINHAQYIVLLPIGSSVTLARLINLNLGNLLTGAELGAGLLLHRLPKGGEVVIDMIKEDYKAQGVDLIEGICVGQVNDTVLIFTEDPLQKSVSVVDILEPALLINRPIPEMYRKLRREAVRYFTHGLEKSEWYEVRINIYDAAEHYLTHARRLELVLEELEVGLILGETWTRDHALTMFSVAAYQIRLFTMLKPLELKTLLLGMEYDRAGERFVDIDLYHRRQKIEWSLLAKKLPWGRKKSGIHYRKELYGKLSSKVVEKLQQLENELD